MLKNILKLDGAQKLSKIEQKNIQGGFIPDLSKLCGVKVFRSTQGQCLSLTNYSPIWIASTGMCSVIGHNCSGGGLNDLA